MLGYAFGIASFLFLCFLAGRAWFAFCPRCGEAVAGKGLVRNPFTNQCLNCGQRLT
jgi:hypothetical protein